jgi:hypothetical protein
MKKLILAAAALTLGVLIAPGHAQTVTPARGQTGSCDTPDSLAPTATTISPAPTATT